MRGTRNRADRDALIRKAIAKTRVVRTELENICIGSALHLGLIYAEAAKRGGVDDVEPDIEVIREAIALVETPPRVKQ